MKGESTFVLDLSSALDKGDERATDKAVSTILAAIEQEGSSFSEADVECVNYLLRSRQQHEYMIAFGELLISEDRNTFETDKHYAQALIDTGTPRLALPLLRTMVKNSETREQFEHYSEAIGLIGRVYKDLYVEASNSDKDAATKHLLRSFKAYREPWKRSPVQSIWHAVNLLALHSNALVNSFPIPEDVDAIEIADSVIATVNRIHEGDRNYWDWASLAEAHVAKEDWESASDALGSVLDSGTAAPFQLNGTLRQFRELWCLQDRGTNGANMVTWLERNLIGQPNSEITLDADDIDRQQSTDESQLEALHSHHRMRSGEWIKKYLQRGESIASVVDVNSGEPKGTCCVIDGEVFSDNLKGQLLCLTNDHVISEFPETYSENRKPLTPDQAAVRFTQSNLPDKKFMISRVIWSSPYTVHDVCLFELEDILPIAKSTIPVVSHVPTVNREKPQEIYIISHPEKDALSFSFQNTDLVDHDAKARGKSSLVPGLIHYTTPTVPGSSGGVALNAELEMVGLHHAGGSEVNKLNDEEGTYSVNEAIWIQPIINAIRSNLVKGIDRWT